MCRVDNVNLAILGAVMSETEMFTVEHVEETLKARGLAVPRERIENILYKLQALGYVLEYTSDQYCVNENIARRQHLQYA